jgi:hypothetical protein
MFNLNHKLHDMVMGAGYGLRLVNYMPQMPEPTFSASLDQELGAQWSVVLSLEPQPNWQCQLGHPAPTGHCLFSGHWH